MVQQILGYLDVYGKNFAIRWDQQNSGQIFWNLFVSVRCDSRKYHLGGIKTIKFSLYVLCMVPTIRTKEAVLTFQNFSSFISVVLSARSFSAQSDRKDRAPIRGTGRSSISGKDGVWEGPSLFIVPTRREVRGKQHKSGSYLVITVGPISQCPPTPDTKKKKFKKCKWQRNTQIKNKHQKQKI